MLTTLRVAAVVEASSLLLLLANLASVHLAVLASLVGPAPRHRLSHGDRHGVDGSPLPRCSVAGPHPRHHWPAGRAREAR